MYARGGLRTLDLRMSQDETQATPPDIAGAASVPYECGAMSS